MTKGLFVANLSECTAPAAFVKPYRFPWRGRDRVFAILSSRMNGGASRNPLSNAVFSPPTVYTPM